MVLEHRYSLQQTYVSHTILVSQTLLHAWHGSGQAERADTTRAGDSVASIRWRTWHVSAAVWYGRLEGAIKGCLRSSPGIPTVILGANTSSSTSASFLRA